MRNAGSRLQFCFRTLFYPPLCGLCKTQAGEAGEHLCSSCNEQLREFPAPRCTTCGATVDGALAICTECIQKGGRAWDNGIAVYHYSGAAKTLVQTFKYKGGTHLTPFMANRMIHVWSENYPESMPDVLMPVPMHWFKRLWRGYNQAALLAAAISKRLDIPSVSGVYRKHLTSRQISLDKQNRQTNVRKSFAARKHFDLSEKKVLVVDDVLTTGATLNAVAQTLKKAGSEKVDVLTFARG